MNSTRPARYLRAHARLQPAATLVAFAAALVAPSLLRAANDATDLAAAASQTKVALAGIGNFGRVDDRLFRGAQPQLSAIPGLKALGVNTIVRLNGEGADVAAEKKQAETLGMRFVNLPWSGTGLPTHEQVVAFLALLHDDPSAKVFVHCREGADRTGVFVALYRLEFNHWTAAQALAEMKQFHYHHFLLPHLENYVESFPSGMSADAELAKFQLPVSAAPPAIATVGP
jgi:protein tyrosine/serine phosphatase